MVLVWCSTGVNMTYFLVCLHTVPALRACVGWDEVTVTRLPMWKSVGHVELCAGCLIICVARLLVCQKVLWIVVAAAAHC